MGWEEKINSNLTEFKNFNVDCLGFAHGLEITNAASGSLTKVAFSFWLKSTVPIRICAKGRLAFKTPYANQFLVLKLLHINTISV
ncbi:hypothetical protein ETZ92_017360 [Bacillus velezensis]|nr:hypothetical protein CEA92_06775 [Bacillus velezensis]QEQ05945.1 hypothetical protein ETZ92_017360 [Bacillus velezensis]